jgi:hypothetical protein
MRKRLRTAAGEFVGGIVPGYDAEIIRFYQVGSIGNAYGESPSGLDIPHGLVGFGEIQGDCVSFLHGSPCRVHHIDTAVFVVCCDHQDRHREDGLSDFELLSHECFLFP